MFTRTTRMHCWRRKQSVTLLHTCISFLLSLSLTLTLTSLSLSPSPSLSLLMSLSVRPCFQPLHPHKQIILAQLMQHTVTHLREVCLALSVALELALEPACIRQAGAHTTSAAAAEAVSHNQAASSAAGDRQTPALARPDLQRSRTADSSHCSSPPPQPPPRPTPPTQLQTPPPRYPTLHSQL